jgi:carbon storage regulator
MLVLSRKKNESIVLNNDVTITVIEIRGDKVRLGVVCPKEVPVHRQEVFDAIHGKPPLPTLLPPPPARPPEETPFLQAIMADPTDEATRLVFADWLEERGDPLGEYIRTMCRLVRLPDTDQRRPALRERANALWGEHGGAWGIVLPVVVARPPVIF